VSYKMVIVITMRSQHHVAYWRHSCV